MKPFITLPRDNLAELLRASGSTLTPEEYVASLPGMVVNRKYENRAWAAAFSKYFLLIVAVLGVITVPFIGFDLENLIIVVGLVTVTYFEFRVHRSFLEGNPEAPSLGFRNQACFAGAILIYCLYHAFFPDSVAIPSEYREVMDPATAGMVQGLERVFYAIVAIVAGGSQFGLALYYRSARS